MKSEETKESKKLMWDEKGIAEITEPKTPYEEYENVM